MSKKQIKLVDFGEPQQFKINRSKPKRIVKTANYKEPEKEKSVPPKGKRPKIKMVNFEKKPLTRQEKISKAIREKKIKVNKPKAEKQKKVRKAIRVKKVKEDKIISLLKNISNILLKKD